MLRKTRTSQCFHRKSRQHSLLALRSIPSVRSIPVADLPLQRATAQQAWIYSGLAEVTAFYILKSACAAMRYYSSCGHWSRISLCRTISSVCLGTSSLLQKVVEQQNMEVMHKLPVLQH